MTLGEIIRQYLDENKITVQQFASKCGYSVPTIYRFLNGKNAAGTPLSKPTVENVSKIAHGLGVSPSQLLNAISSDFSPQTDILLTEDEKRLIWAFRRQNEALKQGIRDMLHI